MLGEINSILFQNSGNLEQSYMYYWSCTVYTEHCEQLFTIKNNLLKCIDTMIMHYNVSKKFQRVWYLDYNPQNAQRHHNRK